MDRRLRQQAEDKNRNHGACPLICGPQPEHTQAGDQRPDIDPDRHQDREQRQGQNARFADRAEQRHQRAQP